MSSPRATRRPILLAAFALATTACHAFESADDPDPPGPLPPVTDCRAVDTSLGSARAGGEWDATGTVCAGQPHQYRLNVGCNPGGPAAGLPACGACTLEAVVEYEDGDDLQLKLRQHNEGALLAESAGATSPEAATAVNEGGGTMAVRVVNHGGEAAAYRVRLTYACP